MPPYNPPNTHYCHCKAYDNTIDNLKLIGPNGSNFKRLTTKLKIEYIWWNIEKNIIELWGPEEKLTHSYDYMNKYMIRFYNNHCKPIEPLPKKIRRL